MKRLIEGAMRRSVLILTFAALILVWGIISAFQMQRDYLPPINNTAVMVTIQADNFQADLVKQDLAAKVEESLLSVDKLDYMETNSYDGGLLASIYFQAHTDMEKAENEVKSAVEKLKLPDGVKAPMVTRVSTNSFPTMQLSLKSNSQTITEKQLRTSIQEKIASEIKRVPGVREIRATGTGETGFIVTLNRDALKKNRLSIHDIETALSSNKPLIYQGLLKETGGQGEHISMPIRINGGVVSRKDLQAIKISVGEGKTIPLQDLANIEDSIVNLKTVSRTDGQPSVLFDVLKTPSSNITEVTERVRDRVNSIPEVKSKLVQVSIPFDQGKEINSDLKGLIKEGILGIVFSIICVFLFFRNFRSTFIISLSLPFCLFTATSILKMMGISLNILTISGLIVAMGRVVDDSIVVMDNMYRKRSSSNKGIRAQLVSGVTEMIPAIVSSTATTIAVFLPISIIGGTIGSAFSGFAWSVAIALAASLAVSILIVPVLAHLMWKKHPVTNTVNIESHARRILQLVFQRKKVVMTLVGVFLAISVTEAALLPVNFFPRSNAGNVAIQIELPEKATLSDVDAEVKNAETILKSKPEVASFSSTLGSSFSPMFDDVFDEGGGWVQKQNTANISVKLQKGSDTALFIKTMRKQMTALSTSAKYSISNQNISGDDSRLKVILIGDNQKDLTAASVLVRSKLQMIPGLSVDGQANDADAPMKYFLSPNFEKMKELGIPADEVLNRIQRYYSEEVNFDFSVGDSSVPIVLRTEQMKKIAVADDPNPEKTILSALGNEKFTANDGHPVTLAEITTITTSKETVISERGGKPIAFVTGNIITNNISGVTNKVKETMKALNLPPGVDYSIGGISKQVKQMVIEMSLALSLSVILVVVIVSAVFRGWQAPAAVLICIPLALIGSVWSLRFFEMEWNLAAMIGVLMLTGIVVTNGIVLVDKIERNRSVGMAVNHAILQGTSTRVRPVLMTAGTTILTLLPLAVSNAGNSIISQTLGVVVIGGMISSTLICLLVIPIMYEWLCNRSANIRKVQETGMEYM